MNTRKLRKFNRNTHRDLGYFFAAMTIIYALSGIALNHISDWDPSYIIKRTQLQQEWPSNKEAITEALVKQKLADMGLKGRYKKHYFPQDQMKVFLRGGNLTVNLTNGQAVLETVRERRVFHEVNFLHYNHIKKAYTWFADIFAVALIILAVSGLFILKGKNGITRRGAWLTLAGLLVPLIFMFIYYW